VRYLRVLCDVDHQLPRSHTIPLPFRPHHYPEWDNHSRH
jgi:hypothetical protein